MTKRKINRAEKTEKAPATNDPISNQHGRLILDMRIKGYGWNTIASVINRDSGAIQDFVYKARTNAYANERHTIAERLRGILSTLDPTRKFTKRDEELFKDMRQYGCPNEDIAIILNISEARVQELIDKWTLPEQEDLLNV